MDTRKSSDGSMSPTAMPNRAASHPLIRTPPLTPYEASWQAQCRVPRPGFSGNPWPGSPSATNLRAGAASFQPGPSNVEAASNRLRFLSLNSTDDNDQPVIVSSVPISQHAVQNPVGTKSSSSASSPLQPREWFTTDVDYDKPRRDGLSGHFLQIKGMKMSDIETGMVNFLENEYGVEIRGKKLLHTPEHGEDADVVLYINDTRIAEEIYSQLQSEGQLEARFVSYDLYSDEATLDRAADPKTMYIGQVNFDAEFKGRTADYDVNSIDVYTKVRTLANTFGEVLAFEQNRAARYPSWQFRVEYYKISAAAQAIDKAGDGIKFPDVTGWVVSAHQYVPSNALAPLTRSNPVELNAVQPVLMPPPPGVVIKISPTGRTAWWTDNHGATHAAAPPRPVANVERVHIDGPSATPWVNGRDGHHIDRPYSTAPPVASRPLLTMTGHVSVDSVVNSNDLGPFVDNFRPTRGPADISPDRIRAGLDVRTTIMIRNIPNHWTRAHLLEKLDRFCRLRYNFMYLRMDFEINKNVGYAFVNFETATDIITFVDAFVGKPWDASIREYGRSKVVQTSYATIQGLDALIDKFRNSSVMDENIEYRPLLLQTHEERLKEQVEARHLVAQGVAIAPILAVGEHKSFPPPNNRAKKERSVANAGQIGLFSPRTHRNGSSRHHRSQYDRGTPAQIMEDWSQIAFPVSPVTAGPVILPSGPFGLGPARMPSMYPPSMGMPFPAHPPPYSAAPMLSPQQFGGRGLGFWSDNASQGFGIASPRPQHPARRPASRASANSHMTNGSGHALHGNGVALHNNGHAANGNDYTPHGNGHHAYGNGHDAYGNGN